MSSIEETINNRLLMLAMKQAEYNIKNNPNFKQRFCELIVAANNRRANERILNKPNLDY